MDLTIFHFDDDSVARLSTLGSSLGTLFEIVKRQY